jgi:hypothetical protein
MKDKALSEVRSLVYVAVGVAAIGGLLFGYGQFGFSRCLHGSGTDGRVVD